MTKKKQNKIKNASTGTAYYCLKEKLLFFPLSVIFLNTSSQSLLAFRILCNDIIRMMTHEWNANHMAYVRMIPGQYRQEIKCN
jgi:hypothetical protein